MYKKVVIKGTNISRNASLEGETIEMKIERIVNNGEPIKDGAPIIYTERKDGVRPEMDIRTDRFEIAIEGMDKVARTRAAQREARIVEMNKGNENNGGTADPKPE